MTDTLRFSTSNEIFKMLSLPRETSQKADMRSVIWITRFLTNEHLHTTRRPYDSLSSRRKCHRPMHDLRTFVCQFLKIISMAALQEGSC